MNSKQNESSSRLKKIVSVTVDPELLKKVDKKKGKLSRSAYIENLIITGLVPANEMNLEVQHMSKRVVNKKK